LSCTRITGLRSDYSFRTLAHPASASHDSPSTAPDPTASDYAGRTYAEAAKTAALARIAVVVADSVGDQMPQDKCMVTRSQAAVYVRPAQTNAKAPRAGSLSSNTVEFFLNCNPAAATQTIPGKATS
jgi:hypothetical protein